MLLSDNTYVYSANGIRLKATFKEQYFHYTSTMHVCGTNYTRTDNQTTHLTQFLYSNILNISYNIRQYK